MIYPNKPLYLLNLLGYIYHLTYYTLTTKDNISIPPYNTYYNLLIYSLISCRYNKCILEIFLLKNSQILPNFNQVYFFELLTVSSLKSASLFENAQPQ